MDACFNAFDKNLFVNDVVNVGGNQEITILELAKTIIKATGSSSEIQHLPPLPEGDMTRRLPDVSKMDALLQRPRKPLAEGIETILKNIRFIRE